MRLQNLDTVDPGKLDRLAAASGRDKLQRAAEGYRVGVKVSDDRVVHAAMVRFTGLLFDLALTPHENQVLTIKIEIDTDPPAGATLETTIVRRHHTLNLQHHDRASLLAGKLHAILQRRYTKGRDLWDLVWYLGDRSWPPPNLILLNNALVQTGWEGAPLTDESWRSAVGERLSDIDWDAAVRDVSPFLGSREDVDLITRDNVLGLIQKP